MKRRLLGNSSFLCYSNKCCHVRITDLQIHIHQKASLRNVLPTLTCSRPYDMGGGGSTRSETDSDITDVADFMQIFHYTVSV